jgi:hypothetical protein
MPEITFIQADQENKQATVVGGLVKGLAIDLVKDSSLCPFFYHFANIFFSLLFGIQ